MPQTKEKREDIIAFEFRGEETCVDSGREALITLCEKISVLNRPAFETLPTEIIYRQKRWFSESKEGMNAPRLIYGTEIYIDVNLKTQDIKKIAYRVIEVAGFTRADLLFESILSPAKK